ncbi:MAG: family 1 encapsulin nanocompartment shell protein [Gammaproteobacteria bacterium]|nr:family 1 encapsulin nanocompartment shell protein [Gammaproteobacteria bacterium]
MNHLNRDLAPISDSGWAQIEEEARQMLTTALAGRKLVDVNGPLGWQTGSVSLGRVIDAQSTLVKGVGVKTRQIRPLVELRVPFEVSREELDAISRGATAPDLDSVAQAAQTAALAEDALMFHGFDEIGSPGMVPGADESVLMGKSFDYATFPDKVVEAVAKLRLKGIEGPYAVALGPQCYEGVTSTTHSGGYPIIDHLRSLIDGPLVWAPALEGSMVLSLRGGDFRLTLGSDFSIGYQAHTIDTVQLYIEESVAFEIFEPAAVVPMFYKK